jgi:hypothetical protein
MRRIRQLLQRVINELEAMLQGNVKSSDSFKLDTVREARDVLRTARELLDRLA